MDFILKKVAPINRYARLYLHFGSIESPRTHPPHPRCQGRHHGQCGRPMVKPYEAFLPAVSMEKSYGKLVPHVNTLW